MGIFKLKTALIGLTSVLAASTSLFADAVVDADFDNNANEFEHYWYYYDDNAGVGKDDRPAVKKAGGDAGTPSTLNVPSPGDTTNLAGDKVKKYTFITGTDDATKNSYATIPFTLGSVWETSYGSGHPFVGIGTQLAADGKYADLTGVTAVKFKIRSHTGAIKAIDFKMQILAVDQYSEVATPPEGAFAYHENSEVPVSTSWEFQTVDVSTLKQPSWLKTKGKFPFDLKTITKLAWEIKEELNPDATDDTIDIDDISLVGDYKFIPPSYWTKKESPLDAVPAKGAFATFEKAPQNKSPLGTYWYAYNDVEIGGTSKVNEGASLNEETGRLLITFSEKTGSDGAGKGALLDYTLGKSVKQGTADVQGFVGIGCNMYDSLESTYWDATTAGDGVTGIYFHYTTMGDLKKATLEISDKNDVADAKNPTRKDTRGSGVVYYRDLPKTEEGVWNAVLIPFDSLIYHSDWAGSQNIPFDKKNIAKIQWKVQGGEALGGKIAIDNIYFPGGPWTVGVKSVVPTKLSSGFHVSCLNGNVNVNWKNNQSLLSGKITLVNSQGAVVSSASITKATTSFSAQKLPAGMYFVRLNAINTSGKAVAMQSQVSIVK